MTDGDPDRHGRVASHPDEFRAAPVDLGGIGEQMAWLSERIEAADQRQTSLADEFGGARPR